MRAQDACSIGNSRAVGLRNALRRSRGLVSAGSRVILSRGCSARAARRAARRIPSFRRRPFACPPAKRAAAAADRLSRPPCPQHSDPASTRRRLPLAGIERRPGTDQSPPRAAPPAGRLAEAGRLRRCRLAHAGVAWRGGRDCGRGGFRGRRRSRSGRATALPCRKRHASTRATCCPSARASGLTPTASVSVSVRARFWRSLVGLLEHDRAFGDAIEHAQQLLPARSARRTGLVRAHALSRAPRRARHGAAPLSAVRRGAEEGARHPAERCDAHHLPRDSRPGRRGGRDPAAAPHRCLSARRPPLGMAGAAQRLAGRRSRRDAAVLDPR